MKALKSFCLSTVLVAISMITTSACAILVDPGPVGSPFVSSNAFTVTSADLTGDEFDVTWTDMKHVELNAGQLYAFGIGNWFGPLTPYSVYLSDEFGAMIAGTLVNGNVTVGGFFFGVYTPPSNVIFHGMHYEVAGIGAMGPLTIQVVIANGPVTTNGQLTTIGEWENIDNIPEPSSITLLGVALAGLGFRRGKAAAT